MCLPLLRSSLLALGVCSIVFQVANIRVIAQDEPAEFQPGIIAEFKSEHGTIRRLEADILYDWATDGADEQFDFDKPFSATWSGFLLARESGQFHFRIFASGQVRVELAGRELLSTQSAEAKWMDCDPIDLRFGEHELRVEYSSLPASDPRLGLYWSGPKFSLEPISSRFYFRSTDSSIEPTFKQGSLLFRGLRCAACHTLEGRPQPEPIAAPSLTRLADNLNDNWLVERLSAAIDDPRFSQSRMPHFEMPIAEAQAIATALFAASVESAKPKSVLAEVKAANKAAGKKRPKDEPPLRESADVEQGKILFASVGCLACHQVGDLGRASSLESQLFGGGDLSSVANKRSSRFFDRWLADPSGVNPHSRMPKVELSPLERLDLAAYLNSLTGEALNSTSADASAETVQRGRELISAYQCSACHELPQGLGADVAKRPITGNSDWGKSCLDKPAHDRRVPGYALSDEQLDWLRHFCSQQSVVSGQEPSMLAGSIDGSRLLAENNCLACHNRELNEGLKVQLAEIAVAVPELVSRLAGLAPPSLNSVGDKLHDSALRAAITQAGQPLRNWLSVRMPKFEFTDEQLNALCAALIAHDRIPPEANSDDSPNVTLAQVAPAGEVPDLATAVPTQIETHDEGISWQLAAARLVTAEGFGCQSCHQIGDGQEPKVDLNARGTNLAMVGDRIRPEWFQRWVRNPARIVPRMEMPAIQTAVRGVLGDSLDMQLDALWMTLNTPGFRPPTANPVRTVRSHNLAELDEPANVLTDVLEVEDRIFIRPLIFGLPNRQNFLFDLETAELTGWWLGDTASQHIRGKSWFWEPGTPWLSPAGEPLERIRIVDRAGRIWQPTISGQFAARLDAVRHVADGATWQGRIFFSPSALADVPNGSDSSAARSTTTLDDSQQMGRWVSIKQTFQSSAKGSAAVSRCTTELSGLQAGDQVLLGVAADVQENAGAQTSDPVEGSFANSTMRLSSSLQIVRRERHELLLSNDRQDATAASWTSEYRATLTTDQFPVVAMPETIIPAREINVVPGFDGQQLPLPASEMPISFAWDSAGNCFAGSLKGRVLQLLDKNEDGLPETYQCISDELPTPFGLSAVGDDIDALCKFALVRLTKRADGPAVDSPIRDFTVVADGWGYTKDYHDWAIGLERDPLGNYYLALPCQQDDRSQVSAYLRGHALRLVPYQSSDEPRQYRIESIAAGLRFPIGIALDADRNLFTTDNQGNYNPFNELNHIRFGKRYGFINKLENVDGFSPPVESPAVNLPHPWTRSVNGICFLTRPPGVPAGHFGPFEGHMIGCEMNGRALIRMSLQKVGETYQGAAYMFSREAQPNEATFEGPIACEVSPDGDLFVGNLQDSGWSGGQNTGSVVRLRPTLELPLGIAEVRAVATGFEIRFTQPVDVAKATAPSNYAIRSYRRVSTPAYGGDDQDERTEKISIVRIAEDRKSVRIEVNNLREGFVYEVNLAPIGPTNRELFPSQAHYSMRLIPK